MPRGITEWVAPGKGATVTEVAAICGQTVNDERRTNLALRAGEETDYDVRRAEEALRLMAGKRGTTERAVR